MDKYTQCKLEKDGVTVVAWIESKYAIKDKIVRIKKQGVWDNNWKVTEVYNTRTKEYVETHERDNLLFNY